MARKGRRIGGARALRRVLAIAALLLAGLALLEIALRIWAPFAVEPPLHPGERTPDPVPSDLVVLDPAIGWRFAADAEIEETTPDFAALYRCNALGFRRNEPYDALAAARTVVFLGASSAFGTGVAEPETLVAHVSRELVRARVANFSMVGFGVDQMWCTLRAYALGERPTLVVLVFVDDDLTRSTTASGLPDGWAAKPTFTLERGRLVELTPERSPPALSRWLGRNLHFSELLRRLDRELGRDHGWGRRWALNRALFAALRDDCLSAGARLLVVHLPQPELWRPFPAYARDFRRLGIDFVDLGAVEVEDPASLYFARDRHLNPAGHAVAGREIGRFLFEQGFAEARLR